MSIKEVKEKLVDIQKFWLNINGINEHTEFGDYFQEPRFGTHETFEYLRDFDNFLKEENVIGKIIIEDVEDNGIPYGLFEIIEQVFTARRIHCG